jgi:glycosyltransferase involved in cell wall biosynthesis
MKKKTNIVHLVEDLPIGGLEKVLYTIALNLDKEKYNVYVWCLRKGGFYAEKLIKAGIEVNILNISTSRNPVNIYKLYRLLKKYRIDIVHTHAYSAGTAGRISAFLAGIPVIISHNHSVYDYYNWYYHLVERLLSFITDRVICISDVVNRFVRETERINANKLVTIHNGIDSVCSVSEKRTSGLRKELGIPINHSIICTITHLEEHKGLKYLLESASLLLGSNSSISFLVVGDGTLTNELKKRCIDLRIEENVVFAGERSDILEILSLIDIFVLPSVREGFGLSLLEAMECGKPIIATNVGGIPEVVKSGVNGILVPPKDPEALYSAMIKLLDDKDMMKKMGYEGKKICKKDFSSKAMVDKVEELYDKLVNEKTALV